MTFHASSTLNTPLLRPLPGVVCQKCVHAFLFVTLSVSPITSCQRTRSHSHYWECLHSGSLGSPDIDLLHAATSYLFGAPAKLSVMMVKEIDFILSLPLFLGTAEWKDPNGFWFHLGDCAEKKRAASLVRDEFRGAGHSTWCFVFQTVFSLGLLGLWGTHSSFLRKKSFNVEMCRLKLKTSWKESEPISVSLSPSWPHHWPPSSSLLCSLSAHRLSLLNPRVCSKVFCMFMAPAFLHPGNCGNNLFSFTSHCGSTKCFSFSRRGI